MATNSMPEEPEHRLAQQLKGVKLTEEGVAAMQEMFEAASAKDSERMDEANNTLTEVGENLRTHMKEINDKIKEHSRVKNLFNPTITVPPPAVGSDIDTIDLLRKIYQEDIYPGQRNEPFVELFQNLFKIGGKRDISEDQYIEWLTILFKGTYGKDLRKLVGEGKGLQEIVNHFIQTYDSERENPHTGYHKMRTFQRKPKEDLRLAMRRFDEYLDAYLQLVTPEGKEFHRDNERIKILKKIIQPEAQWPLKKLEAIMLYNHETPTYKALLREAELSEKLQKEKLSDEDSPYANQIEVDPEITVQAIVPPLKRHNHRAKPYDVSNRRNMNVNRAEQNVMGNIEPSKENIPPHMEVDQSPEKRVTFPTNDTPNVARNQRFFDMNNQGQRIPRKSNPMFPSHNQPFKPPFRNMNKGRSPLAPFEYNRNPFPLPNKWQNPNKNKQPWINSMRERSPFKRNWEAYRDYEDQEEYPTRYRADKFSRKTLPGGFPYKGYNQPNWQRNQQRPFMGNPASRPVMPYDQWKEGWQNTFCHKCWSNTHTNRQCKLYLHYSRSLCAACGEGNHHAYWCLNPPPPRMNSAVLQRASEVKNTTENQ